MVKNIYLVIVIVSLKVLVQKCVYQSDSLIFSFNQNHEYLADRRTLNDMQCKVSTNFIPCISRLVLVLLS